MFQQICVFVLRATALAALLVGIVWNIRFGVADVLARRNRPQDTRIAMRMLPANGTYSAQLADELYASDPASAKRLLQSAVTLNRYDAASWIHLGLLHEAEGDLPGAEQALLRAAKVDVTFLPSWSLANFYFRQGKPADFWDWARKAAQMAPDDAAPLFRLAWYVTPDVRKIESHLEMRRPILRIQFVNFLMTTGDAQAVSEAASNLPAAGGPGGSISMLAACEWLIEHQHPDLALPLWNELARRHQIPYPPLTPESAVTNGRFEKPPISRGFDWRLTTVEGVSPFLNIHPNALGFEFSGDEPDTFLIMDQVAPVQAKRRYALVIDYSSSGIAAGSGIEWVVKELPSGAVLARTGSLSQPEGEAYACFVAPAQDGFLDLALFYQRQPGTVRVQGKLALKEVRLLSDAGPSLRKNDIPCSEVYK